ncbi:hypothetical protein LC76P1_00216 [Lysinibacillus phage LC76P1]|nr:hypothetical protein LC76P1_00216 [Lysinibacillus phage LC76P1]
MKTVDKNNDRLLEILALYASNEWTLYDLCERIVQLESVIKSLDDFMKGGGLTGE